MKSEGIFHIAYRKLQYLYNRAKTWIAYGTLLLLAVVIYWNNYLGPVAEYLIPAAVISMIAILFQTVFSLSANVMGFLKVEEYDNIIATLPRMATVLNESRGDSHRIVLIAITGGTSFNAVFPYLRRSSRKIELEVLLMDPRSPLMKYAPSHWEAEIETTLVRLKTEYQMGTVTITRCALYQNLPAIHGVLINDRDLFMGYAGWEITSAGPVMAGAQLRHRYYSISPYSEAFFELFRDWACLAPAREIDLSTDLSTQI